MKRDTKTRIKTILEKRLLRVSKEVKGFFPSILSEPNVNWLTLWTDKYFMIVFIDDAEKERIKTIKKKGYDPFPGLIAKTCNNVAFNLTKSRNNYIDSCEVKNLYSFYLEDDNTLIISNHKQSINTIELGQYNYKIILAYLISFGNEIDHDNIFKYLDELVAYSVKQWTTDRLE